MLTALFTYVPLAMAAPSPAAASQTQLTNTVCHRALDPTSRRLALTAVMRPVSGTESMAMMFDLERSTTRTGTFAIVRGRGLDVWVHPANPTLGQRAGDIWRLNQKVSNLSGSAYYRFRVAFRWTGANHKPLATVSEFGPLCYQPELRPDLQVQSITVKPVSDDPSEDNYTALIVNRGRTGAGPFELELELPSAAPHSTTVPGLAAHAKRTEEIEAPACTPGSQVTMIADPSGAIDDYDRANATLAISCPSPTQT